MRINVRLDPSRERKLREIQSQIGLAASEAVRQGLDLLHGQQCAKPKDRIDALLASDFIGCTDGPVDLAEQYKRSLTCGLETKHSSAAENARRRYAAKQG